jgi:hypothetical protein
MPYTGLRDAILTHPTMSEGLTVLFADQPRQAGRSNPPQHAPRAGVAGALT